jgi:hypothetical protein
MFAGDKDMFTGETEVPIDLARESVEEKVSKPKDDLNRK